MVDRTAAYASCARDARSALRELSRRVASAAAARAPHHVAAVYAFARAADDFADEGTRPPDERLALLDDWRRGSHAARGRGRPSRRSATASRPTRARSSWRSARRFATCDLPLALFEDLLSAFRQDVTVHAIRTLG